MNKTIFYDIRFESFRGNSYEITTMDVQKAVSLFNRLKGMKSLVIVERTVNECGEEVEKDATADIKELNDQWDLILGKIQR